MKNQLTIGTVFSGIGAIEHALYRLNIDHKILFACDNGDVDILSLKVNNNIEDIAIKYSLLKKEFEILNKELKKTSNSDLSQQNSSLVNEMKLFSLNYEKHIKDPTNLSNVQLSSMSEKISMMFERLNTLKILLKLIEIKDFSKKKEYIDSLYESKLKSNKVRDSYMANYQLSQKNYHWNASFLDGNQYKGKLDLFVGGSPCQSFSLVGKKRGLQDTRGTLFYEFARLVSEIQPKVFIYENVRAVLSNDDGRTWEIMQKVFNDLDYNFNWQLLNAKDYGIPQSRERLFVVGFRKDLKLNDLFSFPPKLKLERSLQDFLESTPLKKYYLPEKGVAFVTSEKNLRKGYTQINGLIALCQTKNQQFNWHGDFIFVNNEGKKRKEEINLFNKYYLSEKVKKYVLSNGTKGFYSKAITDLKIARPLLKSMHKMHRAGIDNYVTMNGKLRKLTPRECLRLMGFSDSFQIVVSDTSIYKQAGNSIVVDVLIEILKYINNSYKLF